MFRRQQRNLPLMTEMQSGGCIGLCVAG